MRFHAARLCVRAPADGDVSLSTWQGQVFSSMMILCGVIFLAMPLNSIGGHFSKAWDERQLHLLKTAMRVQVRPLPTPPHPRLLSRLRTALPHTRATSRDRS